MVILDEQHFSSFEKRSDSCGVYYSRVFIVLQMLNSKTLHVYFFDNYCFLSDLDLCVLVNNHFSSVNNFNIFVLKSEVVME